MHRRVWLELFRRPSVNFSDPRVGSPAVRCLDLIDLRAMVQGTRAAPQLWSGLNCSRDVALGFFDRLRQLNSRGYPAAYPPGRLPPGPFVPPPNRPTTKSWNRTST